MQQLKACKILDTATDEQLEVIWASMQRGGLDDCDQNTLINGVTVDVWIEMVYMECTKRGLI